MLLHTIKLAFNPIGVESYLKILKRNFCFILSKRIEERSFDTQRPLREPLLGNNSNFDVIETRVFFLSVYFADPVVLPSQKLFLIA